MIVPLYIFLRQNKLLWLVMDSTVPRFHNSLPTTFDLSETLSSVLHYHLVNMDAHIRFLTSSVAISFFFCLFSTPLQQARCEEYDKYSVCYREQSCGIVPMYYPFWSEMENRPRYCGRDGFELKCPPEQQHASIQVGSQNFTVLIIDPIGYTMRMVRTDIGFYNACSWDWNHLTNISWSTNLFRFDPTVRNFTIFYDCPAGLPIQRQNFTCQDESRKFGFCVEDTLLLKYPQLQTCRFRIQVPISGDIDGWKTGGVDALKTVLEYGFEVRYYADNDRCKDCAYSKGICVMGNSSEFSCHCPGGIDALTCPRKTPRKWIMKLIVGVSAALFSAIVVSIAFYIFHRRKKNHYAKSYIQSQTISSDSSLKDPDKGSKYFGVHLFSYSELEEATSYFDSAKELGDGGFGTVYYGTLRDGRGVAVKRLYETNGKRVEQFMNEVEILTRLRHPNLVSLYGCTSRHSRELLLVYEYIPNGTVADHLHGEQAEPHKLPWNIRMNIAIETASALAYLHASDIIHRDVKTTNILLDNSFRVKVADFGLSRLFPNDVTHISTAPQGTPGYVDPEYHECYQLTDRSDVYSFGVVLMELISSMPAVDITRHRHEINLSSMAINKIQNRALHELVDPSLGFESDYKVRKMINAVAELAFQCLQSLKDMRPPMEEVLERLKDIQSDGKTKTKAEEMDISADDALLLKNEPPPASPDSQLRSTSTTPNASA